MIYSKDIRFKISKEIEKKRILKKYWVLNKSLKKNVKQYNAFQNSFKFIFKMHLI